MKIVRFILIAAASSLMMLSCNTDNKDIVGSLIPPVVTPNTYFINNYSPAVNYAKLDIDRSTIYSPGINDYHFAHLQYITYFKGKFLVAFANGISGEDEGYQRVCLATSTDSKSWTWKVLLDLDDAGYTVTPGGFLEVSDDMRVLYIYRHEPVTNEGVSNSNYRLFAVTTTDGVNWSEPKDLGFAGFPTHQPTKLKSGRLVYSQNRDIYYTDDPQGLKGWTRAKAASYSPPADKKPSLCEGVVVERGDSVYALMRDTRFKTRLYQSSSDRYATSWTAPRRTKFTNDNSKSEFGVLPDGRNYYIGVPDTTALESRTPLVLALSEDGFNYNKQYIIANDPYKVKYTEGRFKYGQFGYPSATVVDNVMYVVVSRWKETIEVIRIPLDQIK